MTYADEGNKQNNEESYYYSKSKIFRLAVTLIGIGGVILVVFFVSPKGNYQLFRYSEMDLEKTAQAGDYIGGV